MKTGSSDVYELLHVLKKEEISFMRTLSKDSKSQEYQLFECILKNKVNNDTELSNYLEIEKGLSTYKKRLYGKVLVHMEMYALSKVNGIPQTISTEIADNLIARGLHSQARKVLLSVKNKITNKGLSYSLTSQLLRLEVRLKSLENSTVDAYVKQHYKSQRDNIDILYSTNIILEVSELICNLMNKYGTARTIETVEEYNKCIQPLGKAITITHEIESFLCYINSIYAYGVGDYNSLIKHAEKNQEIEESHNNSNLNNLLNAYELLLVGYFALGLKNEVEKIIDLIKNISASHQGMKFFIHAVYTVNRLKYYNAFNIQPSSLKHLQKQVGQLLETDNLYITERLPLYFNMARLLYSNKMYDDALDYIEQIKDYKSESAELKKIYTYSQLLSVMIHCELKNFEFCEYHIRSVERRLNKEDILFDFEKVLLNSCKKVCTHQFNKNEISASIDKLKQDSLNTEPFHLLPVDTWLDRL